MTLTQFARRTYLYPYRAVQSALAREVAHLAPAVRSGVLVDVGCGLRPYEHLFQVDRYIGVDVAESGRPASMKRPDIEFDGQHLPFPDASADHLLCTQVLQFAADPVGFFAELARVLKDDGNLILSAPQSEPMTERPYDRYRFTRDGLTALCLENDLRVLSVRAPLGFWQSFAYDLVCFAAARLYHRGLTGKAALVSVGVVTQTLASALDRFTSYKGNTNSWVIHAARNAR